MVCDLDCFENKTFFSMASLSKEFLKIWSLRLREMLSLNEKVANLILKQVPSPVFATLVLRIALMFIVYYC